MRSSAQALDASFAANDKSGTLFTSICHIFCAVVGAGVLGLPKSVAWLGWIAGPTLLVFFFFVTFWTSKMLADVYRVGNVEFARYHHAVLHLLGRRYSIVAATFQCLHLTLTSLAYTITGGLAMSTAAQRMGSSWTSQWQLTAVMGGIELFLSQLPNMEEIWWVSSMGAITSLLYCFIALILGAVYAKNGLGSIGGLPASASDKAFGCLNALGNLAFAFSFAQVLLEIQDTLKQPPPPARTMKSAINVAVTGAAAFYISVACTGYAALGDQTADEVLNGFPNAPNWPIIVANIAIAIHMLSAFQVFSQPMFETIESHIKAWRIRRQLRLRAAPEGKPHEPAAAAPGTLEQAPVAGGNAGHAHVHFVSPFDTIVEDCATGSSADAQAMARPSPFDTAASAQAAFKAESGEAVALGTRMSSALMSVRTTAEGEVVCNSCPIPDLLPLGGWQPSMRMRRRHSVDIHASAAQLHDKSPVAGMPLPFRQSSMIQSLASQLGNRAMYMVDTGAANERVPLNEAGFYAPLYQRVIIRSAYVVCITVLAMIMPFFSAIVGLVGALTFWPLCVFLPMMMWNKVYKPTGLRLLAMKIIGAFMFLVAVAAAVGSMQSLVVALRDVKFFAN